MEGVNEFNGLSTRSGSATVKQKEFIIKMVRFSLFTPSPFRFKHHKSAKPMKAWQLKQLLGDKLDVLSKQEAHDYINFNINEYSQFSQYSQ